MFQKILCITASVSIITGGVLLSGELIASQKDMNPTRQGAWAAGFLNEKTQDASASNSGYQLWTGGGIMGLEWQLCPGSRNGYWGIAYRYDSSNLDANQPIDTNAGFDRNFDRNFDSTRAIIYSRINFHNSVYLTGMLSAAFNQYNIYQNVDDFFDPVIFGNYDGWQWSAQVELGYQWRYCGFIITPEVSLQYSNLKLDSYEQVRADLLNNQIITPIAGQSDNALFAGFDLNIAYLNQFPKAQVIPYIHIGINNQILENSLQSFTATNVLGNGSAFINSNFPPARTSYTLGAGIEVLGDKNVAIVMSYDYTAKSNQDDHAILLSIKHDW